MRKGQTMKYKAIIFDMDGTIINTEKIWEEATRQLIEKRGIAYTGELKNELSSRLAGLATHKSCGIIKDLIKLSEPLEDLIHEKNSTANLLYEEGIEFIEGFIEFHGKLAHIQIKSAIATNAGEKTIQLTDKALDLKKYFGEHVYGISCVDGICKPDPAIYLYAAEKLGIHPSECIAIEDSAHGIAAARAAGMYCVGIKTSHDKNQTREAHHTIEGYHEIDLEKLMLKLKK